MNKNGLYGFFILFFMTICILLSVGMFFTEQPKPRANEILAPKPLLKLPEGGINKNYLQNVTDYVSDHIAFRAELITIHNSILSKVFDTSASKDVILGKQNWLYYKDTEDDYLGKNILSDAEIEIISNNIKMMQQYVEAQGAKFLFFIAPNKNSLYGQYMPKLGAKFSQQSNAEKLMSALQKQNVNYIDFFAVFDEKEEILYHRLDSHWNNKGAALARDTILETLKIEHNIKWYDVAYDIVKNHRGDLYEMLYPVGKELDDNIVFQKEFEFIADNEIHSPDDIQIDTTNETKQHSLLMFRDSFGNALYPFMADSFGHSRFSRKMPYNLTMMEEVNADVVIVEIVERNIANLAKYAPIFPSPVLEVDMTQLQQLDFYDVVVEKSDLEGYSCIKGIVKQQGKVYIQWQNQIYEAFVTTQQQNEQIFTVYVPEGTAMDLQAVFIV